VARASTENAAQPLVQELMTRELVTVTPETTLRDVADLLAARRFGGAPVLANGLVAGVISASDILSFLASAPTVPAEREDQQEWGAWGPAPEWSEGEEAPGTFFLELWADVGADVVERMQQVTAPEWDLLAEHTAAEAMTRVVRSVPPQASPSEAAASMLRAGVHRLLVMENGQLLGLVTTTDLLRVLAERGG
jgi:CBS domain-containing protein